MSYVVKRVRRSKSRRRRRMRQAATVLVLLLAAVISARWVARHPALWRSSALSSNRPPSAWIQGDTSRNLAILAGQRVAAMFSNPHRIVYPYSVIPGGIQSPEDLRQVSEHDRVVANHYEGFDFENAKIVELQEPRLVYLSYRIGDKVFWTAKKVALRKGEKVITDGKMTARTRCANRVSESAQKGVSPEEPPASQFEEPMLPGGGTATQMPFPENPQSLISQPFGSPAPAPPGVPFGPGLGGGFPPIYPPPPPLNSCTPTKTKPCKPAPPPPPTVPEPATMLLVASGLAGIYVRRQFRNQP